MKLSISLSTRPVSSPGRPDKFPPPLMRFLRTTAGSRSTRGRSRATPIFFRKKPTAPAGETQEPSSPKVTCIGQVKVRARRSKPPSGSNPKSGTQSGCRCRCVNKPTFLQRAETFRPDWRKWRRWRKWGFLFHCRRVKVRTDTPKSGSGGGNWIDGECKNDGVLGEEDEEEEGDEIRAKLGFASSSSTPPKNALLLMRCRSAPYRSSSLACRFWGSPLKSEEETVESQIKISDSIAETKESAEIDGKLGFSREIEGSIYEQATIRVEIENGDSKIEESKRPLRLTRSKSEPARRRGERFDEESCNLSIQRRSGFTESCTPDDVD